MNSHYHFVFQYWVVCTLYLHNIVFRLSKLSKLPSFLRLETPKQLIYCPRHSRKLVRG